MNENFYEAIFKRKSFHLFRGVGNAKITTSELEDIEKACAGFERLYPDIGTAIRIIPANKVNFKRDAEYCVLIYSEEKDNYLMNVGYLGEQLDLYLVSHDIGSLWFGIGKPDMPEYNGMKYVIMIAIRKVNDRSSFRKDMFKAKRKPLEEIWSGDDLGVADVARFAPSACNTQPWYVESKDGKITVYRYKKSGKRGIMPAKSVSYYNRIDVGIYLCILEICLSKKGIGFTRELFVDDGSDAELTQSAEYTLDVNISGPLRYAYAEYDEKYDGLVESWIDGETARFTGLEDGWKDFYGYWKQRSDGTDFLCRMIFENGSPLAVIALGIYENVLTVMEFIVSPEKRNQGHGKAILGELMRRGKEIIAFDITNAKAVIFPDNTASKKAFGSCGFRFDHSHPDGDADYYVFEKGK